MLKRRTRTLEERFDVGQKPDDPVVGLLRSDASDESAMIDLAELRAGKQRKFTVGASPFANITVPGDECISAKHCLLHFENDHLFVKCVGGKNRTLVNGAPLKPNSGYIELVPGAVLTLGETELLACGRAGAAQEPYVVPEMPTFISRAERFYGNCNRAASRVGVKSRTFSRWFKGKFARA